ncbi:galactokinase [Mitsuaria sp. 7]|uniref:galactokinase n=1 Tax=Mitsuaria sp. 7 TaxID=1658665 RepID=UPI00082AB015|nr:galactokinase [Mitsuaria sp. 7]
MSQDLQATPRERAVQGFERAFGQAPERLSRAPARVNLIGEHTDYNEGFAMPCAIDRDTVVAAAQRDDDVIEVLACDLPAEAGGSSGIASVSGEGARGRFRIGDAADVSASPQWLRYVQGMVAVLREQGHAVGGATLSIAGNVPQGAGLSSSASLEMAIGHAFSALNGWTLPPTTMALAGQRAENVYAGCRCGVLDQLSSSLGVKGHALLMDCRSLEVRPIPMPEDIAVLVVDSKIQRGLVDSEYNLRRQQCEAAAKGLGVKALRDVDDGLWSRLGGQLDPVVRRRARHIITDSHRCAGLADALSRGDFAAISHLMRESHWSMRDDFEITVPAIDALAALMQDVIGEHGGARMTGGGFGGCVIALAPRAMVDEIRVAVGRGYRSPDGRAAEVHVCAASDGAGVLA